MGSTWQHPELGRFKFDAVAWCRTIDMPAFKSFSYDTGYRNARRSKGRHTLAFEADDDDDIPSQPMVKLAAKVLANQAELVAKVVKALWADFNGRGPQSGMWWHGGLDEVAEDMDAEKPLQGPDDLLTILQLSQLTVCKRADGYARPVVELSFHAAFEGEHGVGVRTNGNAILGTGYSADVRPFRPRRRRSTGRKH